MNTASLPRWPHSVALDAEVLDRLGSSLESRSPLQKGDHLIRNGERLTSLYVIRSGMLKARRDGEDGREQVLGFLTPGEIVGLGAIHHGYYMADYTALTDSAYGVIPYPTFMRLCSKIDGLPPHILRVMGEGFLPNVAPAEDHDAEQRIVAFLLDLARRLGRGEPGPRPRTLLLPVPQRDIANHLRLAPETVSHTVSRLAGDGLLASDGEAITLLDLAGLEKIGRDVDLP